MNKEYNYRSLSLRLSADGGPVSLDLDSRSMDVTAATENKVTVFDWQRFENVDEVLLMSGAKLPGSRQVVLLDSHDRGSTSSVVGSCRNLRIEGGDLAGRVFFANDAGAESAWGKTRDGHITDFSIGYRVNAAAWVPEGQSAMIDGRAFDGPVRVVTDWTVRELSVCPIGADAAAKARAEANYTMARGQQPAPQRKESDMDQRLRDFLESRGLAKEAVEEAAWEFFRTVSAEPQTPAANVDMDAVVRRAVAEERERSGEIDAMCQRFDLGDLAAGLKIKGASVEEARKAVLDGVAERGAAQPTPAFRVSVGLEDKDKFRSAAQDALCMRAGIAVAAPAAGADELRGYSLREVARHSLMLSGQSTGGNVMEMVGRAMTTTDFPALLANTANKSLAAGYETAPETWQDWCGVGSVGDFKTHDLVSVSETEDLDQINESQPYQYGKRADAKEQYQIVTYGKMFAISRQTIINDDIASLTDIPRAHGEAAARKIGDVVYAVLAANAAMRDGVALFHASHGNLGTSAVISEGSIGEAIKLMKLQKDLLGQRRLNIRPEIYLAPVALEGVAEIFFASNQFSGDTKGSTRANIYGGTRFTRVYDARLDDISSTAWYMAGPKGKTVNVYFLNGQQAPYLESRQGWSVDGVEYKVRIDCGAKAVDWKALLKNAGA
jgi:hypothetical protein